MSSIINCIKTKEVVNFSDIEDGKYFYSEEVLYIKILKQDLENFEIYNVNAVSVMRGGLACFNSDKKVNKAGGMALMM